MINPPKASDVDTVLYSLMNLARHYWLHMFYYFEIIFVELKILGKIILIEKYGKGSYLAVEGKGILRKS